MTYKERIIATYEGREVDHLPRREFYFWDAAIARWLEEGMPEDWEEMNIFGFDESDSLGTGLGLGWTDSPFLPPYEEKIVADEGDYEIIQDPSGRHKRVFKGIRQGKMPQYLRFAVTDRNSWEEEVKPRLNPDTPERWVEFEKVKARLAAYPNEPPFLVTQGIIGGYMHLRNLFGPVGILYAFHDNPDLVRDVMENWLALMRTVLTRVLQVFSVDELWLAEDICYKAGMLISPDLFREFLMPYYQQLVQTLRGLNTRKLYFMVDTDGRAVDAIPLYLECGMDGMTPFEVAAEQDVVEVRKEYPDLIIFGGIDKRILATDPQSIDAELNRIIPFMKKHGRYVPHADHGVPNDVSFANYMHFRKRLMELDH